jgi:teichuronic acid exporter
VREVGFVALQAVLCALVRGLPWVYGWKTFRPRAFVPLWGYGWRIFVADQLDSVGNLITQVILGRRYSTSALGHYQKAEQLQYVFFQSLVSSVNVVMFPVLSSMQDEPERLR